MATAPEHRIDTIEALREVVVENPGTRVKVMPELDSFARDFIARVPFLVLSTSDADGRGDASPKGDHPGFLLIEDDKTIIIPDRPGNKLAMGHENIIANPQVGILLMIPGTNETLRINGKAELSKDPSLLEALAARGRPAVLGIRVEIEECFFHCAKAFIRSKLWQPDDWGQRHRVSFGEMIAARIDGPDDVAKTIDASIEENYRTEL